MLRSRFNRATVDPLVSVDIVDSDPNEVWRCKEQAKRSSLINAKEVSVDLESTRTFMFGVMRHVKLDHDNLSARGVWALYGWVS